MRSRITLLLVLLAAALAALPAAGAGAADSHAPKGARLDWLPTDEWVMSAWMPFDEARLDTVVKTDHDELVTWLNDRRTLLQLAKQHGVSGSASTLAHRLVAPRLPHVSRAMRPVIERRARDMLTQAHLSRHVIFHVFHTPAIPDNAKAIFGMSPSPLPLAAQLGADADRHRREGRQVRRARPRRALVAARGPRGPRRAGSAR